jgi:hypothetical protein
MFLLVVGRLIISKCEDYMFIKRSMLYAAICLSVSATSSADSASALNKLAVCHNAFIGIKAKPSEDFFVQQESRSDGTLLSKLMLVDGVPRGWKFYYTKGLVSRKVYFDDYGQVDNSNRCFFGYNHNDIYTSAGDGISHQMLLLKNGKPHRGFFVEGKQTDDFYTKIHYKGGVAHGQAQNNSFNISLLANTIEKGVFYNGYKNGKFWLKWISLAGATGYDVHDYVTFQPYYDMGELVSNKILYAFPELVDQNILLQKLVD